MSSVWIIYDLRVSAYTFDSVSSKSCVILVKISCLKLSPIFGSISKKSSYFICHTPLTSALISQRFLSIFRLSVLSVRMILALVLMM